MVTPISSVKNFITEGLFLGKGRQALEIVVLRSQEKPNSKLIQQIFNKRRDGRAAPILKPYSSVTIILTETKKVESHGSKS